MRQLTLDQLSEQLEDYVRSAQNPDAIFREGVYKVRFRRLRTVKLESNQKSVLPSANCS